MNELQIFLGLKNREPEAFNILYESLFPKVCYYVEKITGDEFEAQDITNICFAKLWQADISSFDSLTQIKKYIFTVGKNAAFDYLRKCRVHKNYQEYIKHGFNIPDNDQHDALLYEVEMLEILWQEIERLPPQCRQVFKLCYLEKMSRQEVAEIYNISINTVHVHCRNALTRLRQIFMENELLVLLFVLAVCMN